MLFKAVKLHAQKQLEVKLVVITAVKNSRAVVCSGKISQYSTVNLTAQPFIVLLLYRVESKLNKKQFTELTQTDMLHTIKLILQAGEDKKKKEACRETKVWLMFKPVFLMIF